MKIEIDGDAIVSEIEIFAAPDAVFQALTDPQQLVEWWGADGTYRTFNWKMDSRPGGSWSCAARNANGVLSSVVGRILEFDRPHTLAYSWNPSWDQVPETSVRFTLEPTGSGTRLQVVHSGFANHSDSQKSHGLGWSLVLGWLTQYFNAARGT